MSKHYEFKNAKWNELNMPFNDLKRYRYKDIHTKSVKIKNYTYTVSRKR